MNRNEKQAVIQSIRDGFQESQAAFLIDVKGLTVEVVQGLRKGLHQKGGKLKVAKNTLLKKATADLPGLTGLAPYFKDQIAIVFAPNESPAIAKLLFDASKDIEKLHIVAGSLNTKVLTKEQVEYLAQLPSKEVLLAKLCGVLQAPMAGQVSVLSQLLLRLLWVLKAIAEKKQQ